MRQLELKKLITYFDLKILSGKEKIPNIIIEIYGINRAGLELSGFFNPANPKSHRMVLMSSKEFAYISQFDKKIRYKKYEKLLESGIPAIILTPKFKDSVLKEVANKHNFPLLRTNETSAADFTQKLLAYFDDFFSLYTEMHASLVNIYGKGVLLIGSSGIGKSEVTLDLVKKNHLFIGDDRISITNRNKHLYGKPSPILKNLVEVRGIGIIDISLSCGYQVIMDETEISLVIELFNFDDQCIDNTDRLGQQYGKINILGLDITYLKIPVSSGRNISNIVEFAVAQFKIKQTNGIDLIEIINNRINS